MINIIRSDSVTDSQKLRTRSRRQRARLGAPKAITATAHKMARLVYSMLKHGSAYVDLGQDYYEQRYRDRAIKKLKLKAQTFGYLLVKTTETQPQPLLL